MAPEFPKTDFFNGLLASGYCDIDYPASNKIIRRPINEATRRIAAFFIT